MGRFNQKLSKSYYGWWIVGALSITETVSYGVLFYAFTVYITPMEAEFGWSRAQITGGLSLSLLVAGLMAYPVGSWVDRHGARLLMTVGSIGASVLLVAWSQVQTLPAFYAIWLGIGLCGAAVLYEPAFAVVAKWFQRRRSLALTIVTFTAGFASTIFIPLADWLLLQFGWRNAVLILAILSGAITIPLHALVLRRHPDHIDLIETVRTNDVSAPVQRDASVRDVLHNRNFWLLMAAIVASSFGASALRVHLVPYLIGVGIASSQAALATGAIGVMQVVGRVLFTPLDARLSGRTLFAIMFVFQAVAAGLLLWSSALWVVALFVALFGASVGMQTLLRPSVLVDYYGVQHYGRISSIIALPATLSFTAAPVIAGAIFDGFGTYAPTFWIVLLLSLLAVVVIMQMTRPTVSA